jgi:hypothetical protein
MNKIPSVCKGLVGAISICFTVVGGAQAGVVILDDPYHPGEQVVVEFKGCRPDQGQLEKLLPLLRQQQTPASPIMLASPVPIASPVRTSVTYPAHTTHTHLSQALMIGVGF